MSRKRPQPFVLNYAEGLHFPRATCFLVNDGNQFYKFRRNLRSQFYQVVMHPKNLVLVDSETFQESTHSDIGVVAIHAFSQ